MAVVHNRTSPGSRRTCRLHPLPRRTPLDLRPHPLRSTGSPHAAPPPAMGAGYPPPPSLAPPDPCTTRPWRWLLPSPGIPAPPAMKGSSSSGRALQHRQPLSYSCCSTATPPSDGRPWHADMPSRRKSFSLYLEFLTPDLFSVSSNWLSPLSFLDFTLLFPLQLFVTFLPGLLPHFWLVKHAIVLRFNPNQTWVGLAREHDSPSATFRCSHFLGARSPSLSSACCRERWPWAPDAGEPPAKDPPASRPPPRHLHLAGDLHQVPSSAFAILRPCPVALQPERFNRLVPQAEERSSLPRASPAMANQQADPASFFIFLPPRRITPSLSPTAWTPMASGGPYPAVENAVKQFN